MDEYYNQALPFICYPDVNQVLPKAVRDIPAKILEAGSLENKKVEASFPMTLIGRNNKNILLNYIDQWKNEGFIYIENSGQIVGYGKKSFSFNGGLSIDPIKGILKNKEVFQAIFKGEIGEVMYHILTEQKDMVFDSYSLESLIKLPNLESWVTNQRFDSVVTKKISHYLEINGDNLLHNHSKNCLEIKKLIFKIRDYESKGVFSTKADINLWDIFYQRESMTVMLSPQDHEINNLILANIYGVAKDVHLDNLHWQNIILHQHYNFLSIELSLLLFKNLPKSTNWLFAVEKISYDQTVVKNLLAISNTVGILKGIETKELPRELAGRICSTAQCKDNIFYSSDLLRRLNDYQGYLYYPKKIDGNRTYYVIEKIDFNHN